MYVYTCTSSIVMHTSSIYTYTYINMYIIIMSPSSYSGKWRALPRCEQFIRTIGCGIFAIKATGKNRKNSPLTGKPPTGQETTGQLTSKISSNINTRSTVDLTTTSIYYLPSNDSIETNNNKNVRVSTDIENISDDEDKIDENSSKNIQNKIFNNMDNNQNNLEKNNGKNVEIEEGKDIECSDRNSHVRVSTEEGIVTQKTSDVILGDMYKFLFTYIYIYLYTYIYIHIYIYLYIYVLHTYIQIHMYLNIHLFQYRRIYMNICIHIFI
jgi:hypothetical protein